MARALWPVRPSLLRGLSAAAWTLTFSALVKELQDNFGLYDAQGNAEEKLGSLRMKENEQIQKYNIRFNTLAVATGWDLNALKWAYQQGLASRIKDELAQILELRTLAEYRTKVARIDNCYIRKNNLRPREPGDTPPILGSLGPPRVTEAPPG